MIFTICTTAGSNILSTCASKVNSKKDGNGFSLRIVASKMNVEEAEEEEEEMEDVIDIYFYFDGDDDD